MLPAVYGKTSPSSHSISLGVLFPDLHLVCSDDKIKNGQLIAPPQRIKDGAVWKDADQPVLHRDVMQERLLGVNNERVRDPEQLHQPPVQAQALVSLENETLIGPALTEEYGGGVVLQVQQVNRQRHALSDELTLDFFFSLWPFCSYHSPE